MSLLNKPPCLTTNNDYVTEISDPPNGRKENTEYEIDQIRTDHDKYKYNLTHYFNKIML